MDLLHLALEDEDGADGDDGIRYKNNPNGKADPEEPLFRDLPDHPGDPRMQHPHEDDRQPAEHQRVQKADPAVDLEFIPGIVPPLHMKELFQQNGGQVFQHRGHHHP